ncbi:MAG: insulinase family protein [Hyphomicrobiales bacterium]|nr:insulinase family protein [Hyphomicrobiales bacterium]
MLSKLLNALAALAVVAATAGTAFGNGPQISHFTLANGLEVVVIPDHRAPVVTHMLWYRVGSADETPGKSGLAHFLEHLLFKGTEKNPSGRFSQVVAAVGGQENAFTSSDYTGYFQRVPRDKLKEMMEFEADRMTGLVLTDDVVQPELKVVLEEQNMRVANNPGARLGQQMEAALYLNHPYGRPVIGWRHEIESLNREDALAFYRRFYSPNNAILVVAGDVTAEQIRALAEETYAKVPKVADIKPRMRPTEPAQEAARTVTLADPRVTQPSVSRYYLVPSSTTARPGESEALDVLGHILGRGANSRLYQTLVVNNGIAVNAGASYDGTAVDNTRFTVYGAPKPGTTLAQIEQAIDAVLADVIANGVTAEELERSRSRMIADAIYANDNQRTLAQWYGASLATGATVDQVRNWPDRIREVTAGAVRDAARQWLDKRRSVTGYLVKETRPEEKRS